MLASDQAKKTEVRLDVLRNFAAAIVAFAVLLIFFCPAWNIFLLWRTVPETGNFVEVRRAASLLLQVEHPFAPIADPIHRILQWRLLFPLVVHGLHLPASSLLFVPAAGAVLFLAACLTIARREGCDWLTAWCGTVIIGAAGWFFTTTGWLGYFDSWLLLGWVAVSHSRRAVVVFAACLLMPWIEERFVLGLPLAMLIRVLRNPAPELRDGVAAEKRALIGALSLTAFYVTVRLSLAGTRGSWGVTEYLRAQQTFEIGPARFLLGAWESLRFAWILAAAGCVSLLARHARSTRVLFAIGLVCTITGSLVVANDLSRSMNVLVPLALQSLVFMRPLTRGAALFFPGATLVALILPAQLVVTDFRSPVLRCSQVYRAWRHPAGRWTEQSQTLLAIGRLEEADRQLVVAVRLEPHDPVAHNLRGVLAFKQKHWDVAYQEFAEASRWFRGRCHFG